jgi:hypothetical protein
VLPIAEQSNPGTAVRSPALPFCHFARAWQAPVFRRQAVFGDVLQLFHYIRGALNIALSLIGAELNSWRISDSFWCSALTM